MAKAIKSNEELQAYLESGYKKLETSREHLQYGSQVNSEGFSVGKSHKTAKVIAQVLMYAFLIVFALFIIIPFIFMISTSFISNATYEAN